MNLSIFIFGCGVFVNTLSAQTVCDTIYYHNGNIEAAHISEISSKTVSFVYNHEITERMTGYYSVNKIKYRSGRVELLSQRHSVSDEDQWRSVLLLTSEEEVAGLKPHKVIEMHTRFVNFHTSSSGERKLLRKLRQEAARLQCPFILITREIEVKYGRVKFWGLSQHKIRITAYRYE